MDAIPRLPAYSSLPEIDFEKARLIKNELDGISDFETKLIYYNNVQSLATYEGRGEILFKWDEVELPVEIYNASTEFRTNKSLSEKDRIFIKLRSKEVDRIVKEIEQVAENSIDETVKYRNKSQLLFNTPGFRSVKPLIIYPVVLHGTNMYNVEPIVDLQPTKPNEFIIYNKFVKVEWDKIATDNKTFSENYNSANSEKEKEALKISLNKALNEEARLALLLSLKRKIELKFNSIENYEEEMLEKLYADFRKESNIESRKKLYISIENQRRVIEIGKDSDRQFPFPSIIKNLFTSLVLGTGPKPDLDSIISSIDYYALNIDEVNQCSHALEMYKFYAFITHSINIPGHIVTKNNGFDRDEEKEIASIKNNFDTVEIIEVYNHFKNGLVEKKYLTANELIDYMKAAFENMTIPKTLFKIRNGPTKRKIMNVFYDYYKIISGKPHGKQRSYAALLGDYFTGYDTDTVSTNFNK